MSNESATIVQRLWNYCNVLRDDGVSYGDYVEQLTYLLFLKMADEQTKPPSTSLPAYPQASIGTASSKKMVMPLKSTTGTSLIHLVREKGCWGSFSGSPRTGYRIRQS